MVTPADRIKTITHRLATTAPPKRPIEVIDSPEYDPTIRKKRRSEHPLNHILGRRLEQIRNAKNKPPPVTVNLSDSDSEEDHEDPLPEPSTATTTVSKDLDLSISSNSSIEDGEVIEPQPNNNSAMKPSKVDPEEETDNDSDSSNSRDSTSSVPKPKPNISGINDKPQRNVNFDLSANKICEYIPDCTGNQKEHPVYTPTPIVRPPSSGGSVPRKDILFDMWQIIRKIDQVVGRDLEHSMIRRGFLKTRFPR